MSPRRHALGIAVVLTSALTLTPSLPLSAGATAPTASSAAPGSGALPVDVRTEIERVVAEGRQQPRTLARTAASRGTSLVRSQVRCADLDGQTYCLGQGFTTDSEAEVQQRVSARVAARRTATERTGDLDTAAELARRARMSPAERASAERAELTQAARGLGKVWMLRHEIEGVPLPADFDRRYPGAREQYGTRTSATGPRIAARSTTSRVAARRYADYPASHKILSKSRVSEQTRSYWCGPTSMQMIAWNWTGSAESQATWARRLGTTSSGTAITSMVKVVNNYTGWDRSDRAGTYVTLDVGKYTYRQWYLLNMRHYVDYRAPVVLHPILLKKWYPYLDDDASGHFQVGRGYDKRGSRPDTLGYFEPWNQQRFNSYEPYIERVQWRDAYRSYRANLDHFQHNIGV